METAAVMNEQAGRTEGMKNAGLEFDGGQLPARHSHLGNRRDTRKGYADSKTFSKTFSPPG
jgi:hypothetical protein